jgi:hypothetical protein
LIGGLIDSPLTLAQWVREVGRVPYTMSDHKYMLVFTESDTGILLNLASDKSPALVISRRQTLYTYPSSYLAVQMLHRGELWTRVQHPGAGIYKFLWPKKQGVRPFKRRESNPVQYCRWLLCQIRGVDCVPYTMFDRI